MPTLNSYGKRTFSKSIIWIQKNVFYMQRSYSIFEPHTTFVLDPEQASIGD
ncbi:hypothetical protein Q4Q35_08660 [Flavivirga aquimarina]|uniref:Uncharacterized protein n=1 Tax=Flavivirga aquimarina TaxID=2027862 RepID=A0ABT8W9X9_9FLAO|nr:hypothetical protein [Flavivirga aquimarina]MDO5969878.1 hypothetical protein [Flavivirga aquimarina]